MTRVTLKAEVEVTIETNFPDGWSSTGLAADLREIVQPFVQAEYGDVIVVTVTPGEDQR